MTDKPSTKLEHEQFDVIATRAVAMFKEHGITYDKVSALMDIESAHRDIPLDLAGLSDADITTFTHDIGGIRRHMDRTTFPGKLQDCFLPRMALRAT